MASSRWGLVVDALVTLIDATDTAAVFDGPPLTNDVPTDYVIVGGTDDPDDDAGDLEQEFTGLGARTKTERGEVVCAVLAWSGGDDLKACRDRALNVMGQIEDALRNAPEVPGSGLASGWAHLMTARPLQRRNTNGTYVRITFTVAYSTRI